MDEEEGEVEEEEVGEEVAEVAAVGDPEVAAAAAGVAAVGLDPDQDLLLLQEVLPMDPEVVPVIQSSNGAVVDQNTVSPELPLEEEDSLIPRLQATEVTLGPRTHTATNLLDMEPTMEPVSLRVLVNMEEMDSVRKLLDLEWELDFWEELL